MIMSTAGTNDRVPELDLRRFDAGEAARAAFLEELRAAAHGVGFFYIAGHGVETTDPGRQDRQHGAVTG